MLSRFPSTFAIIVEEVLGSTAIDNAPPQSPDLSVWGFFCGGRYRTRTARPRRRRGNQSPSGALISARFPTARNVYRDDYRFVVGGTGLEQQQRPQRNRKFHSAGGYSFIGEYGILGLVQQIRIYIKENIDATVFMFALFKCRKSDKGRN